MVLLAAHHDLNVCCFLYVIFYTHVTAFVVMIGISMIYEVSVKLIGKLILGTCTVRIFLAKNKRVESSPSC